MTPSNRLAAFLLGLLLSLPTPSFAQIFDSFDCTLGLYDDPGLTAPTGTLVPGVPKDLYLGIKFADFFHGLTGLEFSIAGVRQDTDGILVLTVEPLVLTSVIIGSVQSPADTSASSRETGGMSIAWPSCLTGDQALLRIKILALAPVSDRVLRVIRKYPTSNRQWNTPVFTMCDDPVFTSVRLSGNCYGLNLLGPLDCPVQPGNHLPVCDAGGPYEAVCQAPRTQISLSALGSYDPDPGDVLAYSWSSDCPGASFTSYHSPTPTLSVYTPAGIERTCPVSLIVGDGVSSQVCTTMVHIDCSVPVTSTTWSRLKVLYR